MNRNVLLPTVAKGEAAVVPALHVFPSASESAETNQLLERHIEQTAAFYENHLAPSNWFARQYKQRIAHYFRDWIPADASICEIGCGGGGLLELLPNPDVTGIDVSPKQIEQARARVPHGTFYCGAGETFVFKRTFDSIIISETINLAGDVQRIFENIRQCSRSDTRLVLNFYNTLWKPLLSLATALGLKSRHPESNWLSTSDVRNLLALADWEVVRKETRILVPAFFLGLDKLFNRFLAPLLPSFGLTIFMVCRPIFRSSENGKTVSILIPARNEAGNIEPAVRRIGKFACKGEIIFVEGHSTDGTWAEIERVRACYPQLKIRALQQTGRGKGNAVREGFAEAHGDILMILDADLTMPPEELEKFYDVIVSGKADFVNGVRLVYPMEGKAMQFCNMVANKLFGYAFSWLLGQPVKDTLCGTKVLHRSDYEKVERHRSFFGDFDPFGDFDLLFGANKQHLKIVDVPIRYRDRRYGSTNIQRWRHGVLLLRMVLFAARKIKFV
jgi:2-polyprenyl-3-methyl-5-hydroxy-6-metoxy-1,4-benzoquinol methylase